MAQLCNDRVSAEQYGDFISERRFRRSILCHEGKNINLNVTIDAIRDGYFVSNFFYPAGFENHNINSGTNVSFPSTSNLTLNTAEPLELAIQQVFMEVRKEAITIAQMMKRLEAKLLKANYAGEKGKALEDKVLGILMRSIMYGGVQFFAAPMPCVYVVSEKPAVSELVRYQAKQKDIVFNLRHESIQLAPFERLFVQELDGTRDIPALVNAMARHFEAKTLNMGDMGRVISNVAEIKQRLASIIEEKLQACCVMGLLVK
jgi:methyltransferase-like protein